MDEDEEREKDRKEESEEDEDSIYPFQALPNLNSMKISSFFYVY